jgi:hypothetical protein
MVLQFPRRQEFVFHVNADCPEIAAIPMPDNIRKRRYD